MLIIDFSLLPSLSWIYNLLYCKGSLFDIQYHILMHYCVITSFCHVHHVCKYSVVRCKAKSVNYFKSLNVIIVMTQISYIFCWFRIPCNWCIVCRYLSVKAARNESREGIQNFSVGGMEDRWYTPWMCASLSWPLVLFLQ